MASGSFRYGKLEDVQSEQYGKLVAAGWNMSSNSMLEIKNREFKRYKANLLPPRPPDNPSFFSFRIGVCPKVRGSLEILGPCSG